MTINTADILDTIEQWYPVVQDLRPHLTLLSYREQIQRQQKTYGYGLVYLKDSEQPTSILGYRLTEYDDYLSHIDHLQQRQDSQTLAIIMQKITGCKPVIWGTSIVGFEHYHYQYKSGREGGWPLIGFAARKQQNLSLYIMPSFADFDELLKNSVSINSANLVYILNH